MRERERKKELTAIFWSCIRGESEVKRESMTGLTKVLFSAGGRTEGIELSTFPDTLWKKTKGKTTKEYNIKTYSFTKKIKITAHFIYHQHNQHTSFPTNTEEEIVVVSVVTLNYSLSIIFKSSSSSSPSSSRVL